MSYGQMLDTVSDGKNRMGSYAAQLNPKQRGMEIAYSKVLQTKTVPTSDSVLITAPAVVDSAVKAPAAATK